MDLFGEIIEHYNGEYIRNNTFSLSAITATNNKYNGLAYATRFKTRQDVNGTNNYANYINMSTQITPTANYSNQELCFKYTYDQFNQLATSNFFQYNNSSNTFTSLSAYAETGVSGGDIQYDRNGNITRLVRQAYGGNVLDNLTYTVGANNNKLTEILDATTYTMSQNFRTTSTVSPSSFSYNSIGQMTASPAESITAIEYFPDGKVKKIIFANSNTTEYVYGALGEKLKAKFYDNGANKTKYTWYVGPLVYEFDEAGTNSFVIAEARIPGGVLRINTSSITTASYPVYQLTDHLGNVRVTFKGSGTGNGITLLSWNDYYAFGGQLPGRSYVNGTNAYRYGYQGQEKSTDSSNPWYQFELRMYNQDIGRWFAPDPYGQFASPYLAMGNNPISNIDPNGGWMDAAPSYQGQWKGKAQWDEDRRLGQGRYDPSFLYGEYKKREEQIMEQYQSGELSASETTNAMSCLNDEYAGLGINVTSNPTWLGLDDKVNLGMQYANFSAETNGQNSMSLGSQMAFTEGENSRLANIANIVESLAKRSAQRGKSSLTAVVKIMNGEKWTGEIKTIQYNDDGTEVHTIYNEKETYIDEDGDKIIPIVSIEYRSAGYVAQFNANVGNTSLNSMNTLSMLGGSTPNGKTGGWFSNKSDFVTFMQEQSINNPVEVAAIELKNGLFYVQPWDNNYNNSKRSANCFTCIPGYKREDVIQQHHTHPDPSGPGYDDAINSSIWRIPVNVYSNNGIIWQVVSPKSYGDDNWDAKASVYKTTEGWNYGIRVN